MSLYDHTFKWGLNYKFDSYWGKAPRQSKAPRPPKKVIAPGPLFLAKAATVASLHGAPLGRNRLSATVITTAPVSELAAGAANSAMSFWGPKTSISFSRTPTTPHAAAPAAATSKGLLMISSNRAT